MFKIPPTILAMKILLEEIETPAAKAKIHLQVDLVTMISFEYSSTVLKRRQR